MVGAFAMYGAAVWFGFGCHRDLEARMRGEERAEERACFDGVLSV
jgi:hypothetical protein